MSLRDVLRRHRAKRPHLLLLPRSVFAESRASSDATAGATATAARAFNKSARVRRARASSNVRDISFRAAHTTSAAMYGRSGCSGLASSGFSFANSRICCRIRSIHRQTTKLLRMLMISVDVHRCGHARPLIQATERHRVVHAVLGHVAIRRPFPSNDCQQTRSDRCESYSHARSPKSFHQPAPAAFTSGRIPTNTLRISSRVGLWLR